ncbi:LamG domain-containing protein [Parapedobacter tibetensis]|uniref:LamG domain-containing protein n=1 Tax=Parapedobacter tibetensis TaxID=2972951 RepID=UPI00214D996D|nr:LamG domain-containing protein [Parapedobacter tibetensis]
MKFPNYKRYGMLGLVLAVTTWSSCKKDGNPHNLPDVDPKDYEGTIDGFRSTDEIYPDNLIAYFSFNENNNEQISGVAPTSTAGATIVDAGFKGKALELSEGYLYFANQFDAFRTDNLKSFTISQWIQISNNDATKTQLFQLARPGLLNGNIDIILQTQNRPASNIDFLTIQPYFSTIGGSRQDNVNNALSPTIGPDNWVHLVLTYNGTAGTFNIIANGVSIGGFNNRGVGNNLFNAYEPSELIIGGNYNVIPGMEVNGDVSFAGMTGKIDELRIYNVFMPTAIAGSLYRLGLANQ